MVVSQRKSFSAMGGYAAKEIRRLMGKAIHEKEMIRAGDHVVVAVSGGKDSLSLLWLLRERLKRVPINYRITAVYVDPGFGSKSAQKVESFLLSQGFGYRMVYSDCGPKAHGPENLENPCFLCARMRRKALFKEAAALGSDRIAFAHHKDDVIETLFLNIFYGGSVSTMLPVQDFFDGRLTVIRPFYFVEERLIRRYAAFMGWPTIHLGCPTSGRSHRQKVKEMLEALYHSNRKIKGNIFHAMQNVRPEYLP